MKRSQSAEPSQELGPMLRRAWIGYQRRLDDAMADAGFGERGFPDGRILRRCRDQPGTTTAQIGRELGITRQGAGKVVANLCDQGYVSIEPSPNSGREKSVTVTPRALAYLAAHRTAARNATKQLRRQLGPRGFDALSELLDVLGAGEDVRLRDYLRQKGVREL